MSSTSAVSGVDGSGSTAPGRSTASRRNSERRSVAQHDRAVGQEARRAVLHVALVGREVLHGARLRVDEVQRVVGVRERAHHEDAARPPVRRHRPAAGLGQLAPLARREVDDGEIEVDAVARRVREGEPLAVGREGAQPVDRVDVGQRPLGLGEVQPVALVAADVPLERQHAAVGRGRACRRRARCRRSAGRRAALRRAAPTPAGRPVIDVAKAMRTPPSSHCGELAARTWRVGADGGHQVPHRTRRPAAARRDAVASAAQARQPHDPRVVRKVRTPQGRVPGNAWARQRDGKCNRKQTADVPARAQVRVKRCGKSAPAARVTGRLGKPHPVQREQGAMRLPAESRVAARGSTATCRPRWMVITALGRTESGLQARYRKPPPSGGGFPFARRSTEAIGGSTRRSLMINSLGETIAHPHSVVDAA